MQSRKTTPSKADASRVTKSNDTQSSKSRHANDSDLYNASTDDESSLPGDDRGECGEDGLPLLPNFFTGKTFLLYGKLADRRTVVRYITAYDG